MQRDLTSKLAELGDLEAISLQHFDCLVFERAEVVKMFLPRSKRVLGGTARDRMVIGELLLAFEVDFAPLRSPSKRYKITDYIASIPIANFAEIVSASIIDEGECKPIFLKKVRDLLNALPAKKSQWLENFGEDFFDRTKLDRTIDVVRYLNSAA